MALSDRVDVQRVRNSRDDAPIYCCVRIVEIGTSSASQRIRVVLESTIREGVWTSSSSI